MKHWSIDDLEDDTRTLRDAVGKVESELSRFARHGYPRVSGLTEPAAQFEPLIWTFEIDLAPGLTMLTEFAEEEFGGFLDTEGERFAAYVGQTAERAWRLADQIREHLRPVTAALRRAFAEAQRRGLPVRLLRVAVGDAGSWSCPENLTLVLEVEGLSNSLRSARSGVVVWHGERATVYADQFFEEQALLSNLLIEFGSFGVDAAIDALTLRALMGTREFEAALARLRSSERCRLKSGMEVFWDLGVIRSRWAQFGGDLGWDGETCTLLDTAPLQSELDAAVGGPASELVRHEMISADMTVLEATANMNSARNWTTLRLNLPLTGIDLASGELVSIG